MTSDETKENLVIAVSPQDIQQLLENMNANLSHAIEVISATIDQGRMMVDDARENMDSGFISPAEEQLQESAEEREMESILNNDINEMTNEFTQLSESAREYITAAESNILDSISNMNGVVDSEREAIEQQLILQKDMSEQLIEDTANEAHLEQDVHVS